MRTLLSALVMVFLTASVSFAFDTGTWKGKNGDIQGEIKISKKGSDYIADISIHQPSRPNFDEGYCLDSAKTKEVNGSLQVFNEGKLGYTLQKDEKGLKVIQSSNADLPECGDPPSWSEDDIVKMKWKKVK